MKLKIMIAACGLGLALSPVALCSVLYFSASSRQKPDEFAQQVQRLKSASAADRHDAIDKLAEMEDPRALEPLMAMLKDADSEVRAAAANALGGLPDRRAVEPLILLLKDESRTVKLAAALALADIGDKRAVSALNEAVTNEREEETRTQMREALHRLRAAPDQ